MSFETNKSKKKKHDETCLPSWTIRIKICTGLVNNTHRICSDWWWYPIPTSTQRPGSAILVPHQQISTTRTLNRWVDYSHSNFQRNPRSSKCEQRFVNKKKSISHPINSGWINDPQKGSCVSRYSPDIKETTKKWRTFKVCAAPSFGPLTLICSRVPSLLKTNCCSLPVIHWLWEWWEWFDDQWISYLLSQIQGCNLLVKTWLHPL